MDKAKWSGKQIEIVCGQSIHCSLLWCVMDLVGEENNSRTSKMMELWAWWSLSPAQNNLTGEIIKHNTQKKPQLFNVSRNCPKDIFQWRDTYSRKFAKFHYEKQESVVYKPRPASFPQPHGIKLYPEPSTLDKDAQEQRSPPQLSVCVPKPHVAGSVLYSNSGWEVRGCLYPPIPLS